MDSTNKPNTRTPPTISINELPSKAEMRRAFSRRERSVEKPPAIYSQNHGIGYSKEAPLPSGGGLGRSMSRRDKFVKALTNPESIFRHDPDSPPPESKYVVTKISSVSSTLSIEKVTKI
jgi:hypothetical protein